MKCLQANDVVYAYQNKYQTVRALNGVSADFIQGKMYAIIGASGSGKTTFLSLLAGLDVPSAGSITWNGESSEIILADEPTGNLDSENSRKIVEILQQSAHAEGRCVIIVTHDPAVAQAADVILHMQDGKLIAES